MTLLFSLILASAPAKVRGTAILPGMWPINHLSSYALGHTRKLGCIEIKRSEDLVEYSVLTRHPTDNTTQTERLIMLFDPRDRKLSRAFCKADNSNTVVVAHREGSDLVITADSNGKKEKVRIAAPSLIDELAVNALAANGKPGDRASYMAFSCFRMLAIPCTAVFEGETTVRVGDRIALARRVVASCFPGAPQDRHTYWFDAQGNEIAIQEHEFIDVQNLVCEKDHLD